MLSALEDIESAFFGVCIEAGKQVLDVMMEHSIRAAAEFFGGASFLESRIRTTRARNIQRWECAADE